jgi:acetaldehyde dehydrogenase
MVEDVQGYVPGYRLKQDVQFESFTMGRNLMGTGGSRNGLKTSIFLEIEGAGHYLPPYAGNLDIMTSAALKTAERLMEMGQGSGNGNH